MYEIQKADPRARRRAILTVVLIAVTGCLVILLISRYPPALEEWIIRDPAQMPSQIELGVTVLVALTAVPLLAFSAYLLRFASHVVRMERIPPPGYAVIRDTRVFRGRAARLRGRFIQGFAGCLALLACALPVLSWWLLRTLDMHEA